jgi:hypothetical protein
LSSASASASASALSSSDDEDEKDEDEKDEDEDEDMVSSDIVFSLLNLNQKMQKKKFLDRVTRIRLIRYAEELEIKGTGLSKPILLEKIIEKNKLNNLAKNKKINKASTKITKKIFEDVIEQVVSSGNKEPSEKKVLEIVEERISANLPVQPKFVANEIIKQETANTITEKIYNDVVDYVVFYKTKEPSKELVLRIVEEIISSNQPVKIDLVAKKIIEEQEYAKKYGVIQKKKIPSPKTSDKKNEQDKFLEEEERKKRKEREEKIKLEKERKFLEEEKIKTDENLQINQNFLRTVDFKDIEDSIREIEKPDAHIYNITKVKKSVYQSLGLIN